MERHKLTQQESWYFLWHLGVLQDWCSLRGSHTELLVGITACGDGSSNIKCVRNSCENLSWSSFKSSALQPAEVTPHVSTTQSVTNPWEAKLWKVYVELKDLTVHLHMILVVTKRHHEANYNYRKGGQSPCANGKWKMSTLDVRWPGVRTNFSIQCKWMSTNTFSTYV